MKDGIGRWRWRLSLRWPWLSVWKLPPMERVRWWMPEEINTKRKDNPNDQPTHYTRDR